MNEKSQFFTVLGIPFNVTNVISGALAAGIIFFVVFWLSRKITLRPGKRQNVLEWMIDFTNNIVKSALPDEEGKKYGLFAFTLFIFIFVSNQLGLILQFKYDDVTYIKSPTASPTVTLTLAFMVLLTAHFMGVKKMGFKGYLKNTYLSPMPALLPINIIEQFTSFITLALRLYGNIFAGEVLLTLIFSLANLAGFTTFVPAVFLELIWQGFSIFIGSIQAFVFTTLAMVYISQKIEKE